MELNPNNLEAEDIVKTNQSFMESPYTSQKPLEQGILKKIDRYNVSTVKLGRKSYRKINTFWLEKV